MVYMVYKIDTAPFKLLSKQIKRGNPCLKSYTETWLRFSSSHFKSTQATDIMVQWNCTQHNVYVGATKPVIISCLAFAMFQMSALQ